MANTPKAVRATAKRHAEALRKQDQFGKLGNRTTASSGKWPKMSWDEGIKASEYVASFAGRNSKPPVEAPRESRSVQFYSYDANGNRSPRDN